MKILPSGGRGGRRYLKTSCWILTFSTLLLWIGAFTGLVVALYGIDGGSDLSYTKRSFLARNVAEDVFGAVGGTLRMTNNSQYIGIAVATYAFTVVPM